MEVMVTNPPNPLQSLCIDPSLLKDYSAERARPPNQKVFALIATKRHANLPLAIHNYTNRAFMKQTAPDELTLAARTLVTETTTGTIVSRSFSKFFNFHEPHAYKPTGEEYAFSIEEKVDGSIISLFWYREAWMMISRSSFDSPHANAARKILDKQYPGILDKLEKDKSYVFELIDPSQPIKVIYKRRGLVLLSIVSKDGQEPPHNFDWTILPFPRPRIHAVSSINLKELSKLNIENEEGFVIKFWKTMDDRRPQRIKVKFESYLKSTAISIKPVKGLPIFHSPASPPSNAKILEIYTNLRLRIHHFKSSLISSQMEAQKREYFRSLERIADDYGGDAWLDKIEKVWDRIGALFSLQEVEWDETTKSLEREGYKPGPQNASSQVAKGRFEKRIKRNVVDKAYRGALLAWFVGETPKKLVALVVAGIEIPQDLRTPGIILYVDFLDH
jgi:hypothetical protein